MKKIAALPLLMALGLSVGACGKHTTIENADGENIILNDETGTDNLAADDDVIGNNSAEAANASIGDTVNVQ